MRVHIVVATESGFVVFFPERLLFDADNFTKISSDFIATIILLDNSQ